MLKGTGNTIAVEGFMKKIISWLSNPIMNFIFYVLLVIMLPYLIFNTANQLSLNLISNYEVTVWGVDIPLLGLTSLVLISAFIIAAWRKKQITRQRLLAGLVCLAIIVFSQRVMDIYMNMSFLNFQICSTNWHYLVYCGFAFVFFRAFKQYFSKDSEIILYCFSSALALSAFDEVFQLFFSDRVFDISDIAKDAGGVTVGLIILLFIFRKNSSGSINFKQWFVQKRQLRDYLKEPLATLALISAFSLIFIAVSPLLTAHRYIVPGVIITISLFALLLLMLHLIQFKAFRRILSGIAMFLVVIQIISFVKYRNEGIVYNTNGLIVYKGIPIPYFDVLIYPNGMFRFVDKKCIFNSSDQKYLLKQKPSILLVGSGSLGQGGKGFDRHFVYNSETQKGVRVIVLKTPEACEAFNRLKKENKNILFVLHNS